MKPRRKLKLRQGKEKGEGGKVNGGEKGLFLEKIVSPKRKDT